MNARQYHSAYFLGIGGIGMSALARWFKHQGLHVSGYDRTETLLTKTLVQEGIEVHYTPNVNQIPAAVQKDTQGALIIYTPAIKEHPEKDFLVAQGHTLYKRAQVLGLITNPLNTVAVAGTHGKTTTSSMVAHLLRQGGVNMAAFLGGLTQNYGSNLLLNEQALSPQTLAVVEADEFDRSFLQLHPKMAIVTSADADHLDIYGNHEAMLQSFGQFVGQIAPGGHLWLQHSIVPQLQHAVPAGVTLHPYGLQQGQAYATNLQSQMGISVFDYHDDQGSITGLTLEVAGQHNVENMVAAIAVARHQGIPASTIAQAVQSYRGVKRRFEYLIRTPELVYVDDYAHHPAEITALITSLKALYPGRKVTVVFQPHLYSRTQDFAPAFSQSLSLAHEVLLIDIYPAREAPIPGVNSAMLLPAITAPHKELCTRQQVAQRLEALGPDVVATVGAGDIDQLVEPLTQFLKKHHETHQA